MILGPFTIELLTKDEEVDVVTRLFKVQSIAKVILGEDDGTLNFMNFIAISTWRVKNCFVLTVVAVFL